MNTNTKKIIVLTTIVAFLVAIGIGVYFGFQNISVVPDSADTQSSLPIQSPRGAYDYISGSIGGEADKLDISNEDYVTDIYDAQKSKLSILTTRDVSLFWVYSPNQSEENQVFFISDNKLYVIDNGSESIVSELPASDPYKVIQDEQGLHAVVWFKDAVALFDSTKRAWNFFPKKFFSADFSPDGSSLVFLNDADGGVSVSIVDIDNIEEETSYGVLNMYDVRIFWISENALLFIPYPSYNISSDSWLFNLSNNKFEKLFSGNGLDIVSSHNGFIARFVSESPTNLELTIFDMEENLPPFSVNFSTLAQKCSFEESQKGVLICGVPFSLSKKSGILFPDSYLQKDLYTKDEIYRIDPRERRSYPLFDAREVFLDIYNSSVSGDYFYFINRLDNKLYRLDISHE